jgi:hypothetical protein
LVDASVRIEKLSTTVASKLTSASSENADAIYKIYYGCVSATQCVYGDTSSAATVVLFGDSHARMWLPSLLPIAATDQFKIVVLGEDSCPVISIALTGKFSGCLAITASAIKIINALKPSAIIVSDRTSWLKTVTAKQWQTGFTTTLKDLKVSKAKIAVLGDIQIFNSPVIQCLSIHPTKVQTCTVANPNKQQPSHEKSEKAAAATEKVVYVNPTPWLCTTTKCSPVIGNYIAYWDDFHVSVPYASYLSGVVATALKSTLNAAKS